MLAFPNCLQLWDGNSTFSSNTVNYSLLGRRIDIQLKGTILPGYEDSWERILVAIEDVTERENARRELAVMPDALRCAACSSIRRCRFGWRISARSRC